MFVKAGPVALINKKRGLTSKKTCQRPYDKLNTSQVSFMTPNTGAFSHV